MVKLKDFRKTKEIELPSYPGSKVVIYDSLLLKDYNPNAQKSENENMLMALPKLIKEWNFTNDEEKILPINSETIQLLKVIDVTYLTGEIAKLTIEEKKN